MTTQSSKQTGGAGVADARGVARDMEARGADSARRAGRDTETGGAADARGAARPAETRGGGAATKTEMAEARPSAAVSTEKQKAIELALGQIEKNFGKGAIMRMGEAKRIPAETISSGSISLDIALGGGVPRGRVTEIYGPESSGKTTLSLHIIAQAQKHGGTAAFIDAEHALDVIYAEKIGVNVKDLLISQPDSGEQALEIVETLVRSNAVDIIVIDSVAALVPKAEIEGDMGDAHMGLQARLMSQAMRKLTAVISKSKTAVIFINQIRMKLGILFGNPETTSGGNALKFYSSVRMDIRNIGKIEDGTGDTKQIKGIRVRVKVVKNKIAPPFRLAEFEILYNKGIYYLADVLDLAAKYGIARKAGAIYSYKEHKLGQGRDNSIEYLGANPKITKEIEKDIWMIANEMSKK